MTAKPFSRPAPSAVPAATLRICYVLLVHHKFDQVERLVQRLDAPGVSFVVHIDKKVASNDAEALKAALARRGNVTYARRIDARWGSYRQALAIMMGIRAAASQADIDRCILLSGQDYPIASHKDIVAFFVNAPRREFIEAYPLDLSEDQPPQWTPYHRFRRYHVWLGRRHFSLPWLTKPMPPIPIFHGSTWWALTGEAIFHLAAAFETDRRLRRYLRTGLLVDEVYVPSLLMNSPFASRVTGANVTFAQWTATSGAHPKTLELADSADLTTCGKLFARKFDAGTSGSLLDWLDARDQNASAAVEAPIGGR